MDFSRKELLISRIVAGALRFSKGSRVYWLRQPSREDRYAAQQIYFDSISQGISKGLFSDDELLEYLIKNNFWSEEKQSNVKKVEKDIEELKIGIYQLAFKANEQKTARAALSIAKSTWSKLMNERHQYDHHSASGVANLKRIRYLIGCSLYHDGKRVWQDEGFWRHRTSLLDNTITVYINNKLDESQYRELARSEPWRSYWNTKKASRSIFGLDAVDLSEEQKQLIMYSTLYDNVWEHPEAPPDNIVNDDDALDGWLILQRRQRSKRGDENLAEQFLKNDKIKNSGEVFIMAEDAEAATKIDSLNDATSMAIKNARMKYLMKVGEVEEGDMPDSKREIQMQYNRMTANAGKR